MKRRDAPNHAKVGLIRDAPAHPNVGSAVCAPRPEELGDDPYYYGWRERREKTADGGETVRRIPLTYQDLLDPQEGDFIAEDTVHRKVTEGIAGILDRRYESEATVAVWRNLKILFRIPGVTTGPGPDVCVVEGVRDRGLRRKSFRYGQEPGKVRLVIEVVSESSVRKDYKDLLAIYDPMGVEEYVAIHPLGSYADGPFALRGWRRDPRTGTLEPIVPGRQGRILLLTAGLELGLGDDGRDLSVWDATTGELLRTTDDELARQLKRAEEAEERAVEAEERADQAQEDADREAAARCKAEAGRRKAETARREAETAQREAERRAERETAARGEAETARREAETARREAEEQMRAMTAEIERLRGQLESPGR